MIFSSNPKRISWQIQYQKKRSKEEWEQGFDDTHFCCTDALYRVVLFVDGLYISSITVWTPSVSNIAMGWICTAQDEEARS